MRSSAILRVPPQGWSSLLAFVLMLAVAGLAISNAHPLTPVDIGQPWTLALIMVTAGLVGFVLARSSIGQVRSHVIGAGTGALLLILVVAAAVEGGSSGSLLGWLLEPGLLMGRMEALWLAVRTDVDGVTTASAIGTQAAGMLILGAICWTTGQFGASSIYRFDRGVPAVAAAGILLIVAIALPPTGGAQPVDVTLVLGLFTLFAMLLLVRLQLDQQRTGWSRRHIADTGEVSRLFLRTGVIFVAITVVGASALTFASEDTVVAGPWEDWDGQLPEMSGDLERLLGIFGIPIERREPTTFDGYNPIGDRWVDREGTAFRADTVDLRGNYWWANADDVFDGQGWSKSAQSDTRIDRDQSIPAAVGDIEDGRQGIEVAIIAGDSGFALGTLLAPAEPVDASAPVEVTDIGRAGSRGTVRFQEDLDAGDVIFSTALVLDYSSDESELTIAALRASGTGYPPELDRYLEVREGSIGPLTRQLARRIKEDGATPYDQAVAVQEELRSYEYLSDMRGLCDEYDSKTECLLGEQKGFCQYYATTMAMVLRQNDIPTRFVTGYLPGERADDGSWEVPLRALHAWPEVWFEGFGWVRFDPTPLDVEYNREPWQPPRGNQSRETPRGDGGDGRDPILDPDVGEVTPEPSQAVGPVVVPPDPREPGIPVALFVLLTSAVAFVLAGVLATIRLRRLPRADAGLAYLGIVRLATKMGHGPHPAQTQLEYTATLADVVPSVDRELLLVAHATVDSAYGRRPTSQAESRPLRRAYARIRTALVRLLFRRDH